MKFPVSKSNITRFCRAHEIGISGGVDGPGCPGLSLTPYSNVEFAKGPVVIVCGQTPRLSTCVPPPEPMIFMRSESISIGSVVGVAVGSDTDSGAVHVSQTSECQSDAFQSSEFQSS